MTMGTTSKTSITSDNFEILISPPNFRAKILDSIRTAKDRIYISALYLENDEAGYEVLDALYKAKEENENLDIKVFIDFHRAQRGLIGCNSQCGNIEGYYTYKKRYNSTIEIYGVPVGTVEILGVFHLKGFVFDTTVIYSGASLNNVYLNYNEKYRLDRYFVIHSAELANSFVNFCTRNFLDNNDAVTLFEDNKKIPVKSIKKSIKKFSRKIARAHYTMEENKSSSDISVTSIYGLGKRKNDLNKKIIELIQSATKKLTIYTPYFNLPAKISREVVKLLKKGNVEVTIIIGDKTANDFYISPEEDFRKISIVPYMYELNLKKFVKKYQKFIDNGSLNIHLWKNGINTFHLKGVEIDDSSRLLTGNNLNPRGWGLDMENGILVEDSKKLLKEQFDKEYEYIMKDCFKITSVDSIDCIDDYPPKVKTYVRYIYNTRAVKLMKKLM